MEAAGIVDEVGSGVPDRLKVGDAVMAIVVPKGSHGAYREQIVLDARSVVRAPTGKTHPEACSLPMNGLTARQSLDLVCAPRILLVVIGRRSASASASPSRGRLRIRKAATPEPDVLDLYRCLDLSPRIIKPAYHLLIAPHLADSAYPAAYSGDINGGIARSGASFEALRWPQSRRLWGPAVRACMCSPTGSAAAPRPRATSGCAMISGDADHLPQSRGLAPIPANPMRISHVYGRGPRPAMI